MNNKIVECFSNTDKETIYTALKEGKTVLCTTNDRLVPNGFYSTDNEYIIGIDPEDTSYFDFEIFGDYKQLLAEKDLNMINDFKTKNTYEKTLQACTKTFKTFYRQFDFDFIETEVE